jgi:small subunit ribosomal protein S4
VPRPGTPRNKLSRRFGFDLFGTGGASLARRLATPPGAFRRRRRRASVYGEQLSEKQKAKAIYGLDERQFRRQFELASGAPGPPGENLLVRLERRLDNVVYRLGFARTRAMARQLVGHGHVLLDGRRVNIPSVLVDEGSEIRLTESARQIPGVAEHLAARPPLPLWLERNLQTAGVGRVLRRPERSDVEYPIDESRIVAFYSR